jgi:NitT/TauT family transport system permease protein
VIQSSGSTADTALAFAGITLLSIMSIILFYGLVLLEHLLLPWAQETR